jgi:Fe-S cluster biogenesis protein NfuA
MEVAQQLEQLVSGIRPMLVAQGRDVAVLEATDGRIRISLSGFCGGCDCSKDYLEGLREMLTEQFPSVRDIQLEVA